VLLLLLLLLQLVLLLLFLLVLLLLVLLLVVVGVVAVGGVVVGGGGSQLVFEQPGSDPCQLLPSVLLDASRLELVLSTCLPRHKAQAGYHPVTFVQPTSVDCPCDLWGNKALFPEYCPCQSLPQCCHT
jgi:hypothetical protein